MEEIKKTFDTSIIQDISLSFTLPPSDGWEGAHDLTRRKRK
jgi:hypothetical protein